MKWFLGLIILFSLASCHTIPTKNKYEPIGLIYTEKSRIELEIAIESILYNNFLTYKKYEGRGGTNEYLVHLNGTYLYCGELEHQNKYTGAIVIYMFPSRNGLMLSFEERLLVTYQNNFFERTIQCHSNGKFEKLFKDL